MNIVMLAETADVLRDFVSVKVVWSNRYHKTGSKLARIGRYAIAMPQLVFLRMSERRS
jgi:hypothetical protein